jgi:hypothetical protein
MLAILARLGHAAFHADASTGGMAASMAATCGMPLLIINSA